MNPVHAVVLDGGEPLVAVAVERDTVDFEAFFVELVVGLLQVGNLTHAGAAPRSPEVHERVLVGRVVDHRLERYGLPLGIVLHNVDVGLADVGLELLFGRGFQLGQFLGLLHLGRELGDFVQGFLSRKFVGPVGHQYHAEEIVAVVVDCRKSQLLELLFDGLAAFVGRSLVAVFLDQGAAGYRIGVAGVVGRRSGGMADLCVLGVALDRNIARFEDELHGECLRLSLARVEQVMYGRRPGVAPELELAAFDDGRVDQAVALVQVDRSLEPGDVAVDDVFGLVAATAQHGCGCCE